MSTSSTSKGSASKTRRKSRQSSRETVKLEDQTHRARPRLSRSRAAKAEKTADALPASSGEGLAQGVNALKRSVDQVQEQLSLIHGVLEELCERQEALASWQMEFSKRMVMLHEAQWKALEDLAGTNLEHPSDSLLRMADMEKFVEPKGFRPGEFEGEGEEFHPYPEHVEAMDFLDEATDYFNNLSEDLKRKRNYRQNKGLKYMKEQHEGLQSFGEGRFDAVESSSDSVLILPSKSEVH